MPRICLRLVSLLLVGRKRWLLLAPQDLPDAYVNTAISPQQIMSQMLNPVTLEGQDPSRFPDFTGRNKTVWQVDQRPGDILYLPRHWMHHVETLEPSLAINNWPTWARQSDNEVKYYAALTGHGEVKVAIMKELAKAGQQRGPPGIDRDLQVLIGRIVAGTFDNGGVAAWKHWVGLGQRAGGGAPWCSDVEADGGKKCVATFIQRHLRQRYSPWLDIKKLLPSFRIACAPLAERLVEPMEDSMSSMVSRAVAVFRELPLHLREHHMRDWIENLLSVVRAIKRFREIPFYMHQCLQ
eukprot:g1002.t1